MVLLDWLRAARLPRCPIIRRTHPIFVNEIFLKLEFHPKGQAGVRLNGPGRRRKKGYRGGETQLYRSLIPDQVLVIHVLYFRNPSCIDAGPYREAEICAKGAEHHNETRLSFHVIRISDEKPFFIGDGNLFKRRNRSCNHTYQEGFSSDERQSPPCFTG